MFMRKTKNVNSLISMLNFVISNEDSSSHFANSIQIILMIGSVKDGKENCLFIVN